MSTAVFTTPTPTPKPQTCATAAKVRAIAAQIVALGQPLSQDEIAEHCADLGVISSSLVTLVQGAVRHQMCVIR